MNNPVDINETMVFEQYPEVLEMLLKDHTTGKNIFWATDSYSHLGKGYQFNDEIKIEHITEKNGMIIRPRVLKERTEQNERTKGMAEVFTPCGSVKPAYLIQKRETATNGLKIPEKSNSQKESPGNHM